MSDYLLKTLQIGELTMIPFYLVGGPGVGFWMGGWMDQKFDTTPYLRMIFIILGAVTGMRESWRVINKIYKSQNDPKKYLN